MNDLNDILNFRMRQDFIALTDEEYESYLSALMMCGCTKLKDVASVYSTPTVKTEVVYKTVVVRGVSRRVPVSVTSTGAAPSVPSSIVSADGSAFIRDAIDISDTTPLIDSLEASPRVYTVLIGFTQIGDIVLYNNKWGVVTSCDLATNCFEMVAICATVEHIKGALSEISYNVRVIP